MPTPYTDPDVDLTATLLTFRCATCGREVTEADVRENEYAPGAALECDGCAWDAALAATAGEEV